MPDSPSGVYTLPPSYKVANGDLTDSSQHNPPFEDVEQALTNRVHRDGRSPMTGPLSMNGFRIEGVADGVSSSDAVNMGQVSAAIYQIGDYRDTVRTLDSKWLRRDGAAYDIADYPDLAALLPKIAAGIVWTSKSNGMATAARSIIKTDLGYFTAHVSGANTVINYSATAAAWALAATILGMTPNAGSGFAFGNGLLAVVGMDVDAIKVSSTINGSVWSAPTTIPASGSPEPQIAFGNGYFVVSSRNAVSNSYGIYRSANATTWNEIATYGATTPIRGVAFLNGRFVLFCSNGKILVTTDGTSPTEINKMAGSIRCAAFSNGVYLFAGDNGVAYKTTDLDTFIPVDIGTTDDMLCATAYPGGFVLAGEGGNAVISNADASEWVNGRIAPTSNVNGIVNANIGTADFIAVGPPDGDYQYGMVSATQFATPDDEPLHGWIKALV